MKKIKIVIMVISLSVIYQLAGAQTYCSGNKYLMSKGGKGCGCHCQKKCVAPADTQLYKNNGWHFGTCIGSCCWVRNEEANTPIETTFTGVYPNPVSGYTTIFFSLAKSQEVTLKLFDIAGKLITTIASENFEEGDNELIWSAENITCGIYFLQFQSEENSKTIKLSVTK